MRFRKSTHAVYKTQYHIVMTPRYRRNIFVKGVDKYLNNLLKNTDGLEEDIEVRKVNVQKDHVHIVAVIPPRIAVASVISFLKTQSAKKMTEKFDFITKTMKGRSGMWSRGYCVSTVGLNEKQIMDYVEYQEKEDKGQLRLEFGM